MNAKNQFGFQCLTLFSLLLLFHCQLAQVNAAASYAHFKREQQSSQQKVQQQPPQTLQPNAQNQPAPSMQDNHAIQAMMKHTNVPDAADGFTDPYQMMQDLKHETTSAAQQSPPAAASAAAGTTMYWHQNPFMNQANNMQMPPPPNFGFSPYMAASLPFSAFGAPPPPVMETPKLFTFLGFSQPMFIPLPLFYPSPAEMLYSMYPTAMNNFEDSMSRGAGGRRPTSNARDSPIYYMRLPPTPYMFLPNFGYTPATPNFGGGFSPFLPYQPLSAFSGLSPTFNLPLNFLANGKPSGIYQMASAPTNEIQGSYAGMNINNFNTRPSMHLNGYNNNYASSSYGITTQGPAPAHVPDSRMTLLKQPFFFNGRPDEMYILQNSFNPMYAGL